MTDGQSSPGDQVNRPLWVKEIPLFNNTDGLLTRDHWPSSQKRRNELRTLVVLQLVLRLIVLNQYHDKPVSGHLTFQRTVPTFII